VAHNVKLVINMGDLFYLKTVARSVQGSGSASGWEFGFGSALRFLAGSGPHKTNAELKHLPVYGYMMVDSP
jgi:hypothetical protein